MERVKLNSQERATRHIEEHGTSNNQVGNQDPNNLIGGILPHTAHLLDSPLITAIPPISNPATPVGESRILQSLATPPPHSNGWLRVYSNWMKTLTRIDDDRVA